MQHPSMLPHPAARRLRSATLPSGSEFLRLRRHHPPGGSDDPNHRYEFHHRNYSPSSWSEYFTSRQDVEVPGGDVFRVYLREDAGVSEQERAQTPLLVLFHGGGFSGLTWAMFTKAIAELCHIRVMAIDLRGHGSSRTADDEDLSVARVTDDVSKVIRAMYGEDIPEIILMGHSMGGAMAVHYVDVCHDRVIAERIVGLVVIDVVEGTAKEALSYMHQVLRGRPAGFRSLLYAIEWYIRSGQSRNVEAAKISMPGQIKDRLTGVCASDLELTKEEVTTPLTPPTTSSSFGSLGTLSENVTESFGETKSTTDEHAFVWRTNLAASEKYWPEWFDHLSDIFLGPKGGAKLLLLAGIDRLDGPMTVGQMQGKFQMQILPRVGHTIQEDDPESVAHVVAAYLVRNRFSSPKTTFDYPFPSC